MVLLRLIGSCHLLLLPRWYLCGICSFLLFSRLEAALQSGEPTALKSAVTASRWPEFATLLIMFPLGSNHLLKIGMPVLLLFHFGALMAAVLVGDEVDASPLFTDAVTEANTTLNAVSYNILSIHGFPLFRPGSVMELPARFWVLVYWLVMQSVVFWPVWWLSVVWEGKAKAKFLQSCGQRPKDGGDLLRTFKLCVLVQGAVAGLALACILHKPFVASIGSALFNHLPS
jgi:hypothetical protein